MRKEYDMSGAERGKFFGKVDTTKVTIDEDDGPLDETFEEELEFLKLNVHRFGDLRSRLSELDPVTRERIEKRIKNVSDELGEIALAK